MKNYRSIVVVFLSLVISLFSLNVFAGSTAHSLVGVNGYDLVSYHTGKKPLQGNGHYVSTVDGINYLFVNADNLKKFEKKQNLFKIKIF